MKGPRLAASAAAILMATPAHAGVADFLRSQTTAQGRALLEAAHTMPADKYGFRPQTDPMSFGELLLHVAVGNYLFCSRIGAAAEPNVAPVAATEAKEVIVKRLQDSFDYCSRALASLSDTKMSEGLTIGGVKTPRSMAILTLTGTWNTHLTMVQDDLVQNGHKLSTPVP